MTDTEKVIKAAERLGWKWNEVTVCHSSGYTFYPYNVLLHQLLAWAIADRMNWGVEFSLIGDPQVKWAELTNEDGDVIWHGPRAGLPMAVITQFLETGGAS